MTLPEPTDDSLDDLGSLVKAVPYGRHVVAAYKWARLKRFTAFLKGLDGSTSELSEKDRLKFEAYINSQLGIDFLAEYADTAVHSRSETTVAALAILYSDWEHSLFTADFKAAAALALEGISERVVDVLLLLTSQRVALSAVPGEGPYATFALRDADGTPPAVFAAWSSRGEEWVSAVHELIARRILFPDAMAGMRLGDENQTWCCYFGIGASTEQYATLLRQARVARHLASPNIEWSRRASLAGRARLIRRVSP
jgi:hypothetical protein